MVFASPVFVYCFLPACLLAYAAASLTGKMPLKNVVLLVFSLIFYSWGGVRYLILFIISIIINYALGRLLKYERLKKAVLAAAVVYNFGVLVFFKYLSFFAAQIGIELPDIVMPIGISFFTFQIMSYIFDVYLGKAEIQRNPFYLALYIMLFPQLIAGPIIRYADVSGAIESRHTDLGSVRKGMFRFTAGFAKKIFLANEMAYMADAIFDRTELISTQLAWFGAVCYGLQIYMDFSAYSDMAIGLGGIFGFEFLENFNYPYISKSIKEFWRRWHISLSSWFRDYVYIPLGGNRRGNVRTYANLLIVFILTGFWHGADWTFVAWGLFHGAFLIAERIGFGKILDRLPALIRRIYTLAAVLVGWVFFRSDSIGRAVTYIEKMFAMDFSKCHVLEILICFDRMFWFMFAASLALSAPVAPWIRRKISGTRMEIVFDFGTAILFFAALCYMAGMDYNPFIYFRF